LLDYSLISTLAAVAKAGSFEKASNLLGLTPSAISQRIKLLEGRLGVILVDRRSPVSLTKQGMILSRHAETITLIEQEMITKNRDVFCGLELERKKLKIVVNDDSLSSWFMHVLTKEAKEANPIIFELLIKDQDYSIEQMKSGEVLVAVTSTKEAVHGYRSTYLGTHVYRATASPDFARRYFRQGVTCQALKKSTRSAL